MGPKPIQDIAPPPRMASPPAEPSPELEIIGDIPVRAPAEQVSGSEKLQSSKNNDSSFIVPVTPPSATTGKNKEKPKNKVSKPKPTLAIAVALLAVICLAGGAYLEFFSNR